MNVVVSIGSPAMRACRRRRASCVDVRRCCVDGLRRVGGSSSVGAGCSRVGGVVTGRGRHRWTVGPAVAGAAAGRGRGRRRRVDRRADRDRREHGDGRQRRGDRRRSALTITRMAHPATARSADQQRRADGAAGDGQATQPVRGSGGSWTGSGRGRLLIATSSPPAVELRPRRNAACRSTWLFGPALVASRSLPASSPGSCTAT